MKNGNQVRASTLTSSSHALTLMSMVIDIPPLSSHSRTAEKYPNATARGL